MLLEDGKCISDREDEYPSSLALQMMGHMPEELHEI